MFTDLYSNPYVRARIIEFLGGVSIEQATSVYVTSNGHLDSKWYNPRPVSDVWHCLENGAKLGRSLWDRKSPVNFASVLSGDVPTRSPYPPETR